MKQGGVLSSILFSVYLEEILTKLNKNCVVYHMGNFPVRWFAYVDDFTHIAPPRKAL